VDPSLPWEYGETALRIFRKYARLRYRLLPYIYTYACVAVETSLPLMRAMVLEFPDDVHTHTMDLQYLFGREFLVAPIYNEQGKRPVYLPAGRWVDFWSHEVIAGPETRQVEAPLEVMPLYVRANSLIPTIEPPAYLTEAPFEMVTCDAYLLDGGRGSFDLRDTDGVTHVSAALQDSSLAIHVAGVKERIGLRLLPLTGTPAVESVHVNGEQLSRSDTLTISPDADASWARDRDGTIRICVPRRQIDESE
jgi:alpha-D-xyloside xylohydrolase